MEKEQITFIVPAYNLLLSAILRMNEEMLYGCKH